MAVKDYSTTPDLNVQISGINIAEGCPPSGINNAIRQLMADVKVEKDTRDAEQAARDAAQDAAIAEAKSSADEKALSFEVDGLDLVITYGNGTVERVKLPTGKGVGDLWWGHDPKSVPANVQLYSGQLLSRAAYEAHSALVLGGKRTVVTESEWQSYASAHDGMCPYYSSGDGSTTYRMPCIKGVHPKFVAALAEAGQYVAAGLPNIHASWPSAPGLNNAGAFSGAVQVGEMLNTYADVGSAYGIHRYIFGASLSNSIYGNSDTVQPPALTFLIGEYVVGSVAVVGEADAESLLEAINAKADADVGGKGVVRSVNGMAADASGNVAGIGAPDYASMISGVGNNYLAPTDGYYSFATSNSNGSRDVAINGIVVARFNSYGTEGGVMIPIAKGDRIVVTSASTPLSVSIFIPAKGA